MLPVLLMARSGSLPVILELLAMASLPVAMVLSSTVSTAVGVLSLGLGSGIGWIQARYARRGLAVALVRALTAPLAFTALASLRETAVCARAHCSVGNPSPIAAIVLAAVLFIAYAVIPLVSAVMLSLAVSPTWRR